LIHSEGAAAAGWVPPVPAAIFGGTAVENRPSSARPAPGPLPAGSGFDLGWRPKRGSLPVRRRAL